MSNGEDALLLPVERRNGEVPLGVCECLATGLTCHVLGGGGVSLNLIVDILALIFWFSLRVVISECLDLFLIEKKMVKRFTKIQYNFSKKNNF